MIKKITFTSVFIFTILTTIFSQQNMKEPPEQFDIMKWYLTKFPDFYNGWKVEYKQVFYIHGYTEGSKRDIVNVYCDTCGYLHKYSYDIFFRYGYDDKVELSVTQNKDSTNKYFKIMYP